VPGTSDPFGGMPDWKSPFRPAEPQTSMDEYAAVRDQLVVTHTGVNALGRRRLGQPRSEHPQRGAETVRELVGKRRLTERPGATLCVGRAHGKAARWSNPETRLQQTCEATAT